MMRVVTPIAFVLVLVAQLLPAAAPCHAHEHEGHEDGCHQAHDDGAGPHDEHWAAPDGDETQEHDEHATSCRCPCHAPRTATVTAEPAVPVAAVVMSPPTSERCDALGYLETDRPPPRA
jgi:hypothetical protein